MLQWTYNYHSTLSKFGVKDDEVENGYKTLCDAYKIKIHIQLYPLITNVLIKERNMGIEQNEGSNQQIYFTNSPHDIFKIFYEIIEMTTSV